MYYVIFHVFANSGFHIPDPSLPINPCKTSQMMNQLVFFLGFFNIIITLPVELGNLHFYELINFRGVYTQFLTLELNTWERNRAVLAYNAFNPGLTL